MGGKVVGINTFGKASTFFRVFKNLIESFALDAVDGFERETDVNAEELLAVSSAAKAGSSPYVDLGMDLRVSI